MAAPLIALAISLFPELARILAGNTAGRVAEMAVEAVKTVTNTEDPAEAEKILREDPAAAAALKIRLAEIQLEGETLQQKENSERRQAELDELSKRLADTQSARSSMVELAKNGSALSWGAAVISIVVTLGFFASLIILITVKVEEPTSDLLHIIIGALVAAFSTVINFWIGSSSGSQTKDRAASARFMETTDQFKAIISSQSEQNKLALQSVQQAALAAVSPREAQNQAGLPSGKSNFEDCLKIVLTYEGGFSNHPADPGGMTNFGVTRRVYAKFRDIEEAEVTEAMMRDMSQTEVREIYRSGYWTPPRCEELPRGVDLLLFDFSVNAGPRRAIRMLQECLNVKIDGSVGPMTLAAAKTCNPTELITDYSNRRLEYYKSLPTFGSFGRGWTSRVNGVCEAALKMVIGSTDARAA